VAAAAQEKAGVVGAVVRHLEGCGLESPHLEGMLLIYRMMVVFYSPRDVVAAEHAVEHLGGAVDADVRTLAHQGVDEAHVVGVVVRKEYAAYRRHRYAVAAQLPLHGVGGHAGVDEYAVVAVADIGAVARRAGTERYET
jgi:hypothetical protein